MGTKERMSHAFSVSPAPSCWFPWDCSRSQITEAHRAPPPLNKPQPKPQSRPLPPRPAQIAQRCCGETCSVCYEPVGEGTREARKLPCGHSLHRECLDGWLKENRTCPVCRKEVSEKVRRELCEKVGRVPNNSWERSVNQGYINGMCLEHMDVKDIEVAIDLMEWDVACAEAVLSSVDADEEDKAVAQLLIQQHAELKLIHARRLGESPFLWMGCG